MYVYEDNPALNSEIENIYLELRIPRFYDRGDPSSIDFTLSDFTTDEAWHDLDLSNIVPSGAKAVLLSLLIQDDKTLSWVMFRKNGNINEYNVSTRRTQIIDVFVDADIIVSCDVNRVIEYKTENTTFTRLELKVRGWWK